MSLFYRWHSNRAKQVVKRTLRHQGLFAYTGHYAFDPKNKDVGITARGADVPLISLEFNEVGSIWKSFQGK